MAINQAKVPDSTAVRVALWRAMHVQIDPPPHVLMSLAREAGFRDVKHVSRSEIIQRYFSGRADGLQPSSGEEFLVAST